MADIELVIKIDKDYYEIIKHGVEHGGEYKPWTLIAHGTPLKTGHWIEEGHFFERCWAKCSICRKIASGHSRDICGGFEYSFTDYCPNCGAKMEREE